MYKNQNSVTIKKKKNDVSIVDLGYNSAKISVYNIDKNGNYSKKHQYQDYIQLGHNLLKNNNIIESQNIERVIRFLNNFKSESKRLKINTVIPIATSAVRDADNGNEVVQRIKRGTGFEFNVLSGLEEGFFSYLGAQSVMNIPNGIFFDLGGGSIEIIHVENYKIKKIIGLNLGVLRLYDNFVNFNKSLQQEEKEVVEEDINYKQLEEYLLKSLPTKDQFDLNNSMNNKLVGIGGTIRTLYKFVSGIFNLEQPFSYDSYHISMTKKMVDLSNNMFKGLSQEDLVRIKLIDPRRSKTITTGSYIIKFLMEKLDFDKLLVCASGLREGIMENYLYLNMDKKYRSKKKFIELNYNGLSSIHYFDYIDHFQTMEQQQEQQEQQKTTTLQQQQQQQQVREQQTKVKSNEKPSKKFLYELYGRENFPLKIHISKLNESSIV